MKLKVCGMKYNTVEVAALQPDYVGFIFYEESKRNYTSEKIPGIQGVQKAGVFVDASIDFIVKKTTDFKLDAIQLHGDESPEFCKNIKTVLEKLKEPALSGVEVWKVFSIKDTFNFSRLKPYETSVDAFLFDTKGKEKGGNGYTFNWDILKEYPSKKPFILSGGIGLEEISAVKELLKTNLPVLAIDVNSKVELEPGRKNIEDLKKFIAQIK
tara:strand:- start:2398 stop:3033 length:636 start_codon:yes stop_codon:yes gene_type:complete